MPNIDVVGIGCHIGSQLRSRSFRGATERLLLLVDRLDEPASGCGISMSAAALASATRTNRRRRPRRSRSPRSAGGRTPSSSTRRSIVGNAGVLLTRWVLKARVPRGRRRDERPDPAGPVRGLARGAAVRESASLRAFTTLSGRCARAPTSSPRATGGPRGRPARVMSCGAYAMAMSSNYNTRPRAAGLVRGARAIGAPPRIGRRVVCPGAHSGLTIARSMTTATPPFRPCSDLRRPDRRRASRRISMPAERAARKELAKSAAKGRVRRCSSRRRRCSRARWRSMRKSSARSRT